MPTTNRGPRRTMPDLTAKEWELVNEALALLEAHLDDDIEQGFRTYRDVRRVEHVRAKVLERIHQFGRR